ncbi:hypothetical protein [Embleya scabrispora]|uniref:hypothetical protein n=1 Tax=Embleya scabrispora TaxID=159449 RepID=UPI00037D7681|nr:hypothetical protein [Embleya scabrispora]MYS85159.1 hypothetical protein [Streptomyces sp. SID5474]
MELLTPPLTLDYQPSRLHGWFDPEKPETIGGHTGTRDFTLGNRSYRIGLLPFDQAADIAPNPVYEKVPTDPTLRFRSTLESAFGAHYTFRYGQRPPSGTEFRVQSYSVSVSEQTEAEPFRFGADLYVEYDPDPRSVGHHGDGTMRWLQISRSVGSLGGPPRPGGDPGGSDSGPCMDGTGPGNPFYRFGGTTSVRGRRVGTFTYGIRVPYLRLPDEGEPPPLSFHFMAEAFLAQDTGAKGAAGREIVRIFGGVKYGWQLRETGGGRS